MVSQKVRVTQPIACCVALPAPQMDDTLFNLVKTPWKVNPNNSVVAFKDNSSAIRGFNVEPLLPVQVCGRMCISAWACERTTRAAFFNSSLYVLSRLSVLAARRSQPAGPPPPRQGPAADGPSFCPIDYVTYIGKLYPTVCPAARRSQPAGAPAPRLGPAADGGDAQLPVRRGALPRRRDGCRRPHARHARHGHRQHHGRRNGG